MCAKGIGVAIFDSATIKPRRPPRWSWGRCMAVRVDVGDGPAVQAAMHAVVTHYGKIDAVHNNAGIAQSFKAAARDLGAEWDELQRVNLKSVFWTTKFALDALVASKGCILNTASMVGLIGQENHAAYVATKGAMISLTKAMALDYARHSGSA